MGLEISQEQEGDLRILALRGRLDTDTAADLELIAQDLTTAGARDFLIDLSEVGYVSSAGLRVLLALAKQLDNNKGRMRLCGLNPAVAQVFEVAGFARLFTILKDRASALSAISKVSRAPAEPTLADHATRILRSAATPPTPSAQIAALAADVAQLLGVKPRALAGASASMRPAAAAVVSPSTAPAAAERPGMLGKLRGMFGGKK
jgi:anti-anti-sigma factor